MIVISEYNVYNKNTGKLLLYGGQKYEAILDKYGTYMVKSHNNREIAIHHTHLYTLDEWREKQINKLGI